MAKIALKVMPTQNGRESLSLLFIFLRKEGYLDIVFRFEKDLRCILDRI
jgi:hypothetical protein